MCSCGITFWKFALIQIPTYMFFLLKSFPLFRQERFFSWETIWFDSRVWSFLGSKVLGGPILGWKFWSSFGLEGHLATHSRFIFLNTNGLFPGLLVNSWGFKRLVVLWSTLPPGVLDTLAWSAHGDKYWDRTSTNMARMMNLLWCAQFKNKEEF